MFPTRTSDMWQRCKQLCIVFVFEGNGKSLQIGKTM